MRSLLAALIFAAVTLSVPIDVRPEHAAIPWTVGLLGDQPNCTAKAWIGRMGEQPLAMVFSVELDGSVAATLGGETPLNGLPPGGYDLHYEGDACGWSYALVPR
jgi:hypothetical protein